MTIPAPHVALAVALALVVGPVAWARALDPAAGAGSGRVPAESWVHDGTAFPRPGRLDVAAGSLPHVVGARDPFLQPFDSRDAFNMPLSTTARYAEASDPVAAHWAGVRRGVVNHLNGWSVEMVRTTIDDPVRRFTNPALDPGDPERSIDLHVPDDYTPPSGSRGRADGATVLTQPDGTLVDLFRPVRGPDGTWTAVRWERHDARGTGLLTGARAAGVSYAAGLIRAWEIEAVARGELDRFEHRLAISMPPAGMKLAPEPADGYLTHDGRGEGRRAVAVWPANTQDNQAQALLRYRGDVPMGATLALPPDVDVDRLADELGLADDPHAMATLRTLQTFGGVVTDASDSHALYAEPSADPAGVDGVGRAWSAALRLLRPVRDVTPLQPAGGPPPYLWRLAPSVAR